MAKELQSEVVEAIAGHVFEWTGREFKLEAADFKRILSDHCAVIVPREPTEAMREAYWEADDLVDEGKGCAPDTHWRYMLAAQESDR